MHIRLKLAEILSTPEVDFLFNIFSPENLISLQWLDPYNMHQTNLAILEFSTCC